MAQNFLDPIKHICGPVLRRAVKSGETLTVGKMAKLDTYDDQIAAGGNDDVTNIFIVVGPGAPGTAYTTAGELVEVVLVNGAHVVPVLVGSAGATRGKAAMYTSGAFVDATAVADNGVHVIPTFGNFVQSGVSGDYVGLAVHFETRQIA